MSIEAQHRKHLGKIVATKKLIRDIGVLRPRILVAMRDWTLPTEMVSSLDDVLCEFVGRLELNCELNKHARVNYLMFLEPAFCTVEMSYARHKSGVRDGLITGAAVPQKFWRRLIVLLNACARAQGTSKKLPHITADAIHKRLTRKQVAAKKSISKLIAHIAERQDKIHSKF